ncbi:DASH complex subunit Hsk3 like-domain-containing protein [Delphinella strobiligena]|nr:DASH complex subunit Hsk3 like-domain-containing protein [Delphinella strobiligena]
MSSHGSRPSSQISRASSQTSRQSSHSSRPSTSSATASKNRQLSHLHAQLAQLMANMSDLENLLRMAAVQAESLRGLGGYAGGMFMAASKVLGEDAKMIEQGLREEAECGQAVTLGNSCDEEAVLRLSLHWRLNPHKVHHAVIQSSAD